jgi:hypothetical protein
VHYVALVGAAGPIRLDGARLAAIAERHIAELAEPENVLASYLFGKQEVSELGRGAPLSTDDRPFVEFHAADAGSVGSHELAVRNLTRLLALRRRPNELVATDPALLAKIEPAWLGREKLIRGGMAQVRGDHALAERLFAEALRNNPKDRLARAQLAGYRRR